MATILTIDDRAINLQFLYTLLTYFNHNVIEASDGLEGLKILATTNVDLIITDILMPNVDGYELVRRMKASQQYEKIPVIFYTATYRNNAANMLAEDVDVKYVISKPADPQIIIETVNKALGVQENKKYDFNPPFIPKTQKSFKQLINNSNLVPNDINTQLFNSKLYNLIELNLDLVAEKNAQKLFKLFCEGARNLIDAEVAVAVALDMNGKIRFIELSTLTNEECNNRTTEIHLDHPFVKKIIDQRDNFVQNHISKDDYLPPLYFNPVECILAVPFFTSNQLYGFAYFVNKKDIVGFNDQDLILIDPLASQISILYENIESYELIQNQAVHLQLESSKVKKAQIELSQSEKMFRQFAENIKEVFWRTTSSMNEIIYISPGYDAIWGMPSASIYENPCSWQNAVLEEDKENINSTLQKMLLEHENESIQFRIRREDGEIRHIYNKSIFLKDEMGKIDHVIGIASDITKQIFLQKRFALEHELKSILEHSQSISRAGLKTIKAICKIFEWQLGEIWLMNDENDALQNLSVWHQKNREFDDYDKCTLKMKCEIDQDLPGKIWRKTEVVWSKNVTDIVECQRSLIIADLNLKYAIGFPIIFQEDVLGVMTFYSQKISAPDSDFVDMLTMLGSRLGDFMYQNKKQKQLFDIANKGGWNSIF